MKTPPPEFNRLCLRCLRHCKQPAAALLLECPRFLKRPFKIKQHRFDQLDLFAPADKATRTEK